jgi:predicted RNA-binding Zn ribbon-like protein
MPDQPRCPKAESRIRNEPLELFFLQPGLNSIWRDWRGSGKPEEDRLDNPEWMQKWLTGHRISVSRSPNGKEMAALRRLRSLLLQLVQNTVSGIEPTSEQLDQLNAAMSSGSLIQ